MNSCLILRGPLASGKTTIAHKLCTRLNAQYISIDVVLEERDLDVVPTGASCISVANFLKANEIVLPAIQIALEAGKDVVVDACFYHREPLEQLLEALSCPCHVFTLKAPVEVCIERDKCRDVSHGEGAARAVHSLVNQFDYGVVIDATQDQRKIVEDIQMHLL